MTEMIAEYMENGFLENIIDMFKHDRALYRIVSTLMRDERSRVRIGTVALIEALKKEHPKEIAEIIPDIASLLREENPAVRADAAYLLGEIGGEEVKVPLQEAAAKEHVEPVKQVMEETLQELADVQ